MVGLVLVLVHGFVVAYFSDGMALVTLKRLLLSFVYLNNFVGSCSRFVQVRMGSLLSGHSISAEASRLALLQEALLAPQALGLQWLQ